MAENKTLAELRVLHPPDEAVDGAADLLHVQNVSKTTGTGGTPEGRSEARTPNEIAAGVGANVLQMAAIAMAATDLLVGRSSGGAGAAEGVPCTAAARQVLAGATLDAILQVLAGGVAPTGTGGLVRATSPVLITPTLGVASATSLSLATVLAIASGGTGANTAAGARAALGLAIGSDVQAHHANLAALAGLTGAADKFPYFTSASAMALADVTAAARTLLAAASASDQRDALGVAIGSQVQAYSALLAAIAGVAAAADKGLHFTGAGAAAVHDLTAYGRSLLAGANAAAVRALLELGTIATQAASAVAITGGTVSGITDLAVADGGTGASTAAGARTNLGLATVSQAEAEAGTATTERAWTAERVAQAIAALGGGAGNPWTEVLKTADESRNTTTTLTDDGALVAALAAGTSYVFELFVHYKIANDVMDFKTSVAFSGTTTGDVALWIGRNPVDGTTFGSFNENAFGVSRPHFSGSAGIGYLTYRGVVTTNAAGNLTFQWAQNSSNASDATVLKGSLLRFRPLT